MCELLCFFIRNSSAYEIHILSFTEHKVQILQAMLCSFSNAAFQLNEIKDSSV